MPKDTIPLVSIIVRTKDRPQLLKRALQSIANQTYRPIEVVLVNDGGCDLDIPEIRGLLGDVSLNYQKLEKNTGRAHAGNVGIENAKGNYLGLLDDDDEFYPGHVETLVAFLDRSDYKIAYTDTEMVYQSFSSEEKEMITKAVFSNDFVFNDLLISNYIPFNSLLFNREIFLPAERLDESFELYEDWDFLIRLGHKYNFFHIGKITTRYYQWSRELQINQLSPDRVKSAYTKILGKHRDSISPLLIFNVIEEKKGLAMTLQEREITEAYKNEHISRLEETIKDKDIDIADLKAEMREKDGRILGLTNDLDTIRRTLGWKMLERFRSVRGKLLPFPARRKELFHLAIKSIKVLRNEGLRAVALKAKRKLKGAGAEVTSLTSALALPYVESPALVHFPTQRAFRVLFVKWEWAGITNHYRVDNMAEYLRGSGTLAEVLDLEDLPHHIPRVFGFDLVVIHRIPMTPLLKAFISACRSRNIVSVFDIDDYLFEASVIHQVEWVKHTKGTERKRLIEHMMQCRQTLEACDYFISPTEFLAKKAEEIGRKAFVIRNGFSEALYRSFLDRLQSKAVMKSDGKVRIGYFSGTNTHQKDFQHIIPALLQVLRECESATLYICGLLEMDRRFAPFSERIERVPFVPLEELPAAMLPCDINIAPLESGNIFCEAKSELKYIYAGLMKIPSVTSPTDAFRHAITHGENGFLASTVDEWYARIKALVNDPELRAAMGNKAHDNVRNFYSPHALAQQAGAVYREIIKAARHKRNIPEKSFSTGFIIADNPANQKAYRHISAVAEELANKGHRITYYYYGGSNGNHAAGEIPGSMETRISVAGIDAIISHDVLVCTDPHNSSVTAYQQRERAANLAYMPGPEKYVDIPYPWATLFHVIPYSSNVGDTVSQLENIIWEPEASRKS